MSDQDYKGTWNGFTKFVLWGTIAVIAILVILALIIFTQVAPVWFNVPTVIPTVIEGFSILGIQFSPDIVEYVTIQAGSVLKMDEIFGWATMIIEFYFGAQLAKGK